MAGIRRPRRAFSLVEILVVVVIVTALVVCALPAFHTVHNLSLRAQCSSRIHHLSSGLLLYAYDHEQTLPSIPVANYHNPEGIWFTYGTLIVPYLDLSAEAASNSPQVFSCPMVRNDVNHPSYLFNSGNQYDQTFPGLAGKRLVEIRRPTRTLLLYEFSAVFPVSWHTPQVGLGAAYQNAKNVASFADGHVAYIPFYWDGSALSPSKDPPDGYEYEWSGN